MRVIIMDLARSRASQHSSITVEYLHGRYDGALATHDERSLQTSDRLAAQLSVAF